jgi:polyisoprenoid-binding protein YceI
MRPAFFVIGLVTVLAAPLARAEPAEYVLDPEHVTVGFLTAHIGYAKVLGQFLEIEGVYHFDEDSGELSNVAVTVNTASVITNHDDRDRHLRSDDFLDVRAFPTMRFTADGARRTGERTFEIAGRLELLGRSEPLTLSATWNKSETYPIGGAAYVMGVSARGSLRRSAFGMNYAVENGWVGDDVEIIVEFEARRR